MGMGRDQFLGLFWQISPYPLLWQWGYSEHSSMFLTNFGVPGGSFLLARIRKKKLQSITGHPKKSVSRTVHLFFVWLYCCFIQTWCINNDWKSDFWHPRCLFYQVESILFHFQQLRKNFPKIPMKYSKNGQKFTMSENTSNVLFGTCRTQCKKMARLYVV